jgi:TPR repeat protein
MARGLYLSRLRDADWQSLPGRLVELIDSRQLSRCLLEVQAWAAKGDSAACIALAHAYYYGGYGVDQNFNEAKRWLEKIDRSEDCIGFAPHLLGVIHYKGLTETADHRKAYRYFRQAALLGNMKARIMVAFMQRDGDGTLKKPYSARSNFYRCSRDPSLSVTNRWFCALQSAGSRLRR